MHFEIVGEISQIETFAIGSGIHELARLRRIYGRGRRRKRKGVASVRLGDGSILLAEAHLYEASGIGRKEFKINEASLEKRKIYLALADAHASEHGMIRVIDESGEDYLFPSSSFHPITLTPDESKAILAAA